MSTRSLTFATVALAAALAVASPATGGKRIATTVTFDHFCGSGACSGIPADESHFWGAVSSRTRACQVGRRVKLFEAQAGKPRELLGVDRTDSRGHWYVQRPGDAVGYVGFAKAPRLKLRPGKACAADRSDTIVD